MKTNHPLVKRVFLKYAHQMIAIGWMKQRLLRQRRLSDQSVDQLLWLHGVWPGSLSPLARRSLNFTDLELSEHELMLLRLDTVRGYRRMEQRALATLDETNSAKRFIIWFDGQASKGVLFSSPWSDRLQACPDYVKAAYDVWARAETSYTYRHAWCEFFRRHREAIASEWMSADERAVLAKLKEPLIIYRGYNKPKARRGLSWTLNKQVAAKITTGRFRGRPNPWVVTARVNPEDVIAYRDRPSGLQEIIIEPVNVRHILNDEPVAAVA